MWLTVGDDVRHLRPGDEFDLDRELSHSECYGPETRHVLGSAQYALPVLVHPPLTQYVQSGDISIAYQVVSAGPSDFDRRAGARFASRPGLGEPSFACRLGAGLPLVASI